MSPHETTLINPKVFHLPQHHRQYMNTTGGIVDPCGGFDVGSSRRSEMDKLGRNCRTASNLVNSVRIKDLPEIIGLLCPHDFQ